MMLDEVKITVVPEGTLMTDIHGTCPKCSYNFKGEDVRAYFRKAYTENYPDISAEEIDLQVQQTAAQYGWTPESPKCFSNIIGIEVPGGYDGVMFHQCPECKTVWDRFTCKEITITPTTLKETENGIETNSEQQ